MKIRIRKNIATAASPIGMTSCIQWSCPRRMITIEA